MIIVNRNVRASRRTPNRFSRQLFAPLPKKYNLLAQVLSFAQDRRWRSEMIRHVVPSRPKLILDVACGPGAVTTQLARSSEAKIIGIDLSPEMLHAASDNIARGYGDRVWLVQGHAEELPFPDATFDALTFTYLLRYVADPQAVLKELARVVKPGGRIASLEFAVPTKPVWRVLWWIYTRIVLPLAGLLTGGKGWMSVGRFLGPSISSHYRHYSVDWTVDAWRRAGIDHVEWRTMSLGGGLVMWGYRSD
ncbi:MAG: class I SAM-dependent methyltransferase [Acidobacteria bacterium]|nr:class I SAM-dependent methyltransferase [Acidobacteriota bacterium]